jgi:hypothetical protein
MSSSVAMIEYLPGPGECSTSALNEFLACPGKVHATATAGKGWVKLSAHSSTLTASSTVTTGTGGIFPRFLATYRSRLSFADTDDVLDRLPATMRERVIS